MTIFSTKPLETIAPMPVFDALVEAQVIDRYFMLV